VYSLVVNIPAYFFFLVHLDGSFDNYDKLHYAKRHIDTVKPISDIVHSPTITKKNILDRISDIRKNNLTEMVIEEEPKKEGSGFYISKKYLWKYGKLILIREYYKNGSLKKNTRYLSGGGVFDCGDKYATHQYYPSGILQKYYEGESCEEARFKKSYDEKGWIIKQLN
jgi:antitoxin component YwqK of YwqJK toxin-antitoxin module